MQQFRQQCSPEQYDAALTHRPVRGRRPDALAQLDRAPIRQTMRDAGAGGRERPGRRRNAVAELVDSSQGAVGSLQAQQATNQLLALSAKQQLQIQTLMAAQYRVRSARPRRARRRPRGSARAATRRFLGSGGLHAEVAFEPPEAAGNYPPSPPAARALSPRALARHLLLPIRNRAMDDLNVIDRFMETFIRYIDSGFGLLGGDVAFLTTILDRHRHHAGRPVLGDGRRGQRLRPLIKKILYVGAFALILEQLLRRWPTSSSAPSPASGCAPAAAALTRGTTCSSPAGSREPASRPPGRCSTRSAS